MPLLYYTLQPIGRQCFCRIFIIRKTLFMLLKCPLLFMLMLFAILQVKGQKLFTSKISYAAPVNPNNESAFDSIQGSALLLKTWVRGTVINMNDSVITDPDLRMNYDKLDGHLIVTRDNKNFLYTEKRDIKGFILYTDSGRLIFTKVPEINAKDFFQLLGMGKTCTVYKRVSTAVKGSGYAHDGSAESVARSARFVDYNAYYIMDVDDRNKFSTRFFAIKRSVRAAFSFDNDRLEQYFTEHRNETINDAFIIRLTAYFNKK